MQLWYLLKFRERTRHSQPAGPGRHDNPNYLPLQPRFQTGRRPLCSSGICISLRQVLKVGEWSKITRNANTSERNVARSRKKNRKVTHGNTFDSLTGISIVKHFLQNYSLKHVFTKTFQSSAGGFQLRFDWTTSLYFEMSFALSPCFFFYGHVTLFFPSNTKQLLLLYRKTPTSWEKSKNCEIISQPSTLLNYFLL